MSVLRTPLGDPRLFASYGTGEDRLLPVIGLDADDRPLVLTAKGDVVLARKTRVDGETFMEMVVR